MDYSYEPEYINIVHFILASEFSGECYVTYVFASN